MDGAQEKCGLSHSVACNLILYANAHRDRRSAEQIVAPDDRIGSNA